MDEAPLGAGDWGLRALERRLRDSTFARYIEIHDELASTNDRAAELARDPRIELPALVVARRQTAGRGRGSNMWWSAEGSLTFSLLIDPQEFRVAVANWPQLSLAVGVGVCDVVQQELREPGSEDAPARVPCATESHPRVAVKWPNDVMVDDAKVCGILIESPAATANANPRLVIGIGINVNNSWRDAPHDLSGRGIAVCDVTGQSHDIMAVLIATLQQLEWRIRQLAAQDAELQQAWQRHSWLTGHRVEVQSNGPPIYGECLGFADDGALLVQTHAALQRFVSGTVRRV